VGGRTQLFVSSLDDEKEGKQNIRMEVAESNTWMGSF
jgi:hypothetical protein